MVRQLIIVFIEGQLQNLRFLTFVGWTDAATIFFIKVMASKNTPFIPAFCDGKMSIKGTHYYFLAKQKHCCCLLSHGGFLPIFE